MNDLFVSDEDAHAFEVMDMISGMDNVYSTQAL